MSNEIYIPSLVSLSISNVPTDDGIKALQAQLHACEVSMTKARAKVDAAIKYCVKYSLSLTDPEARRDAINTIRSVLKGTFLGSFDVCMGLIRDGLVTTEADFDALDFTSQARENKTGKVNLGLEYLTTMLQNRVKKVTKMVTVGDASNDKDAELSALALMIEQLENIKASAK